MYCEILWDIEAKPVRWETEPCNLPLCVKLPSSCYTACVCITERILYLEPSVERHSHTQPLILMQYLFYTLTQYTDIIHTPLLTQVTHKERRAIENRPCLTNQPTSRLRGPDPERPLGPLLHRAAPPRPLLPSRDAAARTRPPLPLPPPLTYLKTNEDSTLSRWQMVETPLPPVMPTAST